MNTKTLQIEKRVGELDQLADEVSQLSEQFFRGDDVQPQFSIKGEKWVRGARELLVQHNFSGLKEFDECYKGGSFSWGIESIVHRERADFHQSIDFNQASKSFKKNLRMARGLVASLLEELKSRELDLRTALSLAISSDEMSTAQDLLDASKSNESLLRAAGVVARVALERHLLTIAESRNLPIQLNPPTKKKAEASDALLTLYKSNVVTPIQRSELEGLFTIANHCAHAKEIITPEDVQRLIERGKLLAAVIG
jgi:hypothetical protein